MTSKPYGGGGGGGERKKKKKKFFLVGGGGGGGVGRLRAPTPSTYVRPCGGLEQVDKKQVCNWYGIWQEENTRELEMGKN